MQNLAAVMAIVSMAVSFALLASFCVPTPERLAGDIPALTLAALSIPLLLFARKDQKLVSRILCSTLLVGGVVLLLAGAWCTAEDIFRPVMIERETFEPEH